MSRRFGSSLVMAAALAAASLAPAAGAAAATPPAPLATAPARPVLSTGVRQLLADTPKEASVTVVVELVDKPVLPDGRGRTKSQRQRDVVQSLRSHADRTQAPLRTQLLRRMAQGSVEAIQPLWISNSIVVTARPSVIEWLSTRPEVASITPNEVDIVATSAAAPTAPAGPLPGRGRGGPHRTGRGQRDRHRRPHRVGRRRHRAGRGRGQPRLRRRHHPPRPGPPVQGWGRRLVRPLRPADHPGRRHRPRHPDHWRDPRAARPAAPPSASPPTRASSPPGSSTTPATPPWPPSTRPSSGPSTPTATPPRPTPPPSSTTPGPSARPAATSSSSPTSRPSGPPGSSPCSRPATSAPRPAPPSAPPTTPSRWRSARSTTPARSTAAAAGARRPAASRPPPTPSWWRRA